MSADSASSRAAALFPREPRHVGKFEFLMRLGQGGMATVFLARSVSAGGFQRLAAIKLMHQFLASDEQFVEMFLDEARVAAHIRHPNVVSIVDLGNETEHLFMVMDYVEGDTLAAVEGTAARLGRAIPLGIVLRIVLDALAGLDAAHELRTPDGVDMKVVHRDVSPQNILVGVDGAARLTDFGIARAEHRIASTRTGMLKGKAPFMAPEQFEGRPVDRRVDVFAMGVTLWEAVALRRLFPGRESYEAAVRNARAPYRKLKDVLPSVPASLDAIVKKALAPDPADRFPSAAAFADALEGEFRSMISSHRQVGAFMTAVAAEKIQRERDAVRNAPKPPNEPPRSRSSASVRPVAPGAPKKAEAPVSQATVKAFESRPPSVAPANDVGAASHDEDDDDPEVAAALRLLTEVQVVEAPKAPAKRVPPPPAKAPAPPAKAPAVAREAPPRMKNTVLAPEPAPGRAEAPGAAKHARLDEIPEEMIERSRPSLMLGPPRRDGEEPRRAKQRTPTNAPQGGQFTPSHGVRTEAGSTTEFALTPSKRKDFTAPEAPSLDLGMDVTITPPPMRDPALARAIQHVNTGVAPRPAAAADADADGRRSTRFPSLAPAPRDGVWFGNRWVSGFVLAMVLLVVGFVLTRGL